VKNRIPEGDARLPKKLAGFLRKDPPDCFRIISQNFPSLLSPRKEIPSIWPMVPARSVAVVIIGAADRCCAGRVRAIRRSEIEGFGSACASGGQSVATAAVICMQNTARWRGQLPSPSGIVIAARWSTDLSRTSEASSVSLRVLLAVQSHWDNLRTMRAIVSRRRTCSSAGLYGEAGRR